MDRPIDEYVHEIEDGLETYGMEGQLDEGDLRRLASMAKSVNIHPNDAGPEIASYAFESEMKEMARGFQEIGERSLGDYFRRAITGTHGSTPTSPEERTYELLVEKLTDEWDADSPSVLAHKAAEGYENI